jgi:hypothetical protein
MIPFRSAAVAAIALVASTALAAAQTAQTEGHAAAHSASMAQAESQSAQPGEQGGMAMQGQNEDNEDEAGDDMPGPGMMGPGMMGPGMMGPGMMCRGMMGPGMMMHMMQMHRMMQMMRGMADTLEGATGMMQGMMMPWRGRGMMPGAHVEGRLAFLKAELGITEAQMPQWNAFADAVRTRVKTMQEMRAKMIQERAAAESWPDRLARHEQRLSARLDALKAMEGPTRALWDALSDEQRHKAEELMPGPMGMMGTGMGMGMGMGMMRGW